MEKVLILGGGSYGTSLSILLNYNKSKVFLWEYSEDVRLEMKNLRTNNKFLPGYKLDENIEIVDSIEKTVKDNNIKFIILATPVQFQRNIIKELKNCISNRIIIINVAKGIEIKSEQLVSEIVKDELNGLPYEYVILTGPTHAEELVKNIPSAILAASNDLETAKEVQLLFTNDFLRVYSGTDVVGAELGGALKNCLAIMAGMADGLGLGDNSKAALITRGLKEIIEIGNVYGAQERTFTGLSGIGDIMVTCNSKHSRNRYVGECLGKGETIDEITVKMNMVAEGVETIKAINKIIEKKKLNAPIFSGLYKVLYENKTINDLINYLLIRELKTEF